MNDPTLDQKRAARHHLTQVYQAMTIEGAQLRTRLVQAYGPDVARDIVCGDDPSRVEDLARWRNLGEPG